MEISRVIKKNRIYQGLPFQSRSMSSMACQSMSVVRKVLKDVPACLTYVGDKSFKDVRVQDSKANQI